SICSRRGIGQQYVNLSGAIGSDCNTVESSFSWERSQGQRGRRGPETVTEDAEIRRVKAGYISQPDRVERAVGGGINRGLRVGDVVRLGKRDWPAPCVRCFVPDRDLDVVGSAIILTTVAERRGVGVVYPR